MPPYGRDAGMTQRDADALAERVTAVAGVEATVEHEGRYFVLTVDAPTGRYRLRDEADWDWLRRQVEKG